MPKISPPPTVLLTGPDGFVGRHVVAALQNQSVIKKLVIADPVGDEVAWDLSREPTSELMTSIGHVDQVIHLAALTPKAKEDNQLSRAHLFYMNNVLGTINLLRIAGGKNVTHITYVSTLDVYGFGNGEISEDTPIHPETYYASSKLTGEQVCQLFCEEHNIALAILRLGHVYGPGEGLYKKVIPIFLAKASKREPLLIYGSGRALRDFIYVKDVADAIAFASRARATGVYNVVKGSSISVLELAAIVNRVAGSESGVIFTEKDYPEVDFVFRNDRLRALGYEPRTTLEEGLRAELEYLR